jgi:ATP-binding cassette subfamily B protein
MLFLDAQLALIVLIPVPLVSLGAWLYSRRYDRGTRELQESWAQASTLVEETVSGIRVVKGLGAGAALEGRFRRRSDEIMDRALHLARLDAVFVPFLEMLPLLGIAAVLWFGGRRVISGELSVGSFVAFNAYVVMLVWPLRVLGQRVTTLQKALGASGRITEVLEAEPRLLEPRHPEELERPVRGDVRLEGVRFGHEGDHAVLDGLDLHVAPGESVALVGATGSGKSTVAGLLARLYDPEDGLVLLDGHDLRDLRLDDVRRSVALVFEETFLFSESVRENIRVGRPDAGDEDVQRAAELAGAADFVSNLPDGYDTILGERGFSLSGGQRQRIAIARAILADPALLVLDDATSAVDATKEHEIRTALTEVMRGRTTLVIAHRPATIALADRVAVLEGGGIVEQGTHDELIAGSARYRALLALEEAAA